MGEAKEQDVGTCFGSAPSTPLCMCVTAAIGLAVAWASLASWLWQGGGVFLGLIRWFSCFLCLWGQCWVTVLLMLFVCGLLRSLGC